MNRTKGQQTTDMFTGVSGLNPRQWEAVEYCDGPLLVIAGPGTGKTRVITEKVLHLIRAKGLPPGNILALTFTEKAAEEMGARIRSRLMDAGIRGQPTVDTFHGFCLSLVTEFADRLGFSGPLRLLVGPLYVQFIADHIDKLVTEHSDLVQRVTAFARTLADFTSRCHDEGLIGKDLKKLVEEWVTNELDQKERHRGWEVHDLAASLPLLLRLQYESNVVTYGDLLTLAVRLLNDNDDLRRDLQNRYRYILVDELQDNNSTQFELVNKLAAAHHRVLVVGDEDQCIYRFRGAGLGLVERFRKHWDDLLGKALRTVTLEENYRSTPAIIDVCQALIRHNSGRSDSKILRQAAESEVRGPDHVAFLMFETDEEERRYLVHRILKLIDTGERRPGDIAILARSLPHVRTLVSDLRRHGVAVEVVGEGGLFSNFIVRELIAWLKALDDPNEEEIALHRVLRLQSFGLSFADQRALGLHAKLRKKSAMTVVEQLATDASFTIPDLSADGHARLRSFWKIYHKYRDESHAATRPDITGLLWDLLEFTGLVRRARQDSVQGRLDTAALAGFLKNAENYQDHYPDASLHSFMRYIELLEEIGHDETVGTPSANPETLKVMTVHQSKGREFPVVFVTGLSDRFPSPNRREWHRKFLDHVTLRGSDVQLVHQEEERRVLYVALSRAQQELTISLYAKRGENLIKDKSTFPVELENAPSLQTERILPESVPVLGLPSEALRTRQAVEARLHHLISRLGLHMESTGRRESLLEVLRLFAGLLAEVAGAEAVRDALEALGLPKHLELAFLQERAPAGVVGPLQLSASSMQIYSECQRQYYYRHVVGIPTPARFAAQLGTAIHKALEEFHRRHGRLSMELQDNLLDLFATHVADVDFRGAKEREQGLARGRTILSLYLKEEVERSASVKEVEVEREFAISLGPDVTITGKIDRVDHLLDGRVRVVDYKTGKLDSRPQFLAKFQMPTYAWAVREALGAEVESVEVVGLKELDETASGPRIARQVLEWENGRYPLTQARLDELKAQALDVVKGIREGRFDALPNEERCQWCAFRLLCDKAWGCAE